MNKCFCNKCKKELKGTGKIYRGNKNKRVFSVKVFILIIAKLVLKK